MSRTPRPSSIPWRQRATTHTLQFIAVQIQPLQRRQSAELLRDRPCLVVGHRRRIGISKTLSTTGDGMLSEQREYMTSMHKLHRNTRRARRRWDTFALLRHFKESVSDATACISSDGSCYAPKTCTSRAHYRPDRPLAMALPQMEY